MTINKANYNKYAKAFIADGMTPLTYKKWAAIKAPHHEQWVD